MGKWSDYWSCRANQIRRGLNDCRQSGHARIELKNPRPRDMGKGKRFQPGGDLYSSMSVGIHGADPNPSGKQHMGDLGLVIAGMLKREEKVEASIVRDGDKDYLVFKC